MIEKRGIGKPRGSIDRNGPALRVPLRAYARDWVALTVGEALRRSREAHDVAVTELAEATGLSSALLHRYERGATLPPLHQLWRIAAALGVRLDTIIGDLS